MSQVSSVAVTTRFAVLLLCLSTLWSSAAIGAQGESIAELKEKATELTRQTKYTEALPLLEKIVVAEPDNALMHFYLGFALIAQANNVTDLSAQKQWRVRSRNEFIKAKELGQKDDILEALIQGIPADGGIVQGFSQNIRANALMVEAEAFFGQGKLDDSLKNYKQALELDPKIYEAALFSGDVYMHKEDFAQAEVWYQKAISIDPNRETAYRYSATPLMKQKRYNEARDRYIEAYISEPYSRFSAAGIGQWAQITSTKLGYPQIDIPTNVTFNEKGDANINLDVGALMGGKDDGSFAWISYGATRSIWHKETFAKTFPDEKTYRHSLPEETDALRSVVTLATSDKKAKTLNPSIAKLKKLNDEGLLEAFILLARPDAGIARDHAAYLKQNRDKLRLYVVKYVLTGGGD